MNYLDLGLVLVVAAFVYRGATRGGYRSFVSLLQNILAIALAIFCQAQLLTLMAVTPLNNVLRQMFEVGISVPTGPDFSLNQALQWLKDAELPQALADAVQSAWRRESSADVAAFSQAAGHILAKAVLNLMCFLALFIVMRWIINIFSRALVRALPIEVGQYARSIGVSLGIIESIIISAVIVAILAPFVATTMVPVSLIEYYRTSKLVGVSLLLLKWAGSILYGV
ncbi:MAG: hypothetical protein Q8S19_06025 [Bacillota bacterium]|nr:hypothetical protein [Bacillota bacterium]